MTRQRLSIIGVGLLGGSIGLAVKAAGMPYRVVGYGHRPTTLEKALEIGAIDESADCCAQAAEGADLVILCTPVGLFKSNLEEIAAHLKPQAIVTDVGSTKRSVVKNAQRLLPKSVSFVGSHPMAGSEKRGVEFARADLFQGATCILTPTAETNPQARAAVEAFWAQLGMRVTELSPEQHDRLVSDISHLPHLVAAALVSMQEDAALQLAGKGFLDVTRVAAGDAGLWRDILMDNHDHVARSVEQFCTLLINLLKLIQPAKANDLTKWLESASRRREALLQQKLREINPD